MRPERLAQRPRGAVARALAAGIATENAAGTAVRAAIRAFAGTAAFAVALAQGGNLSLASGVYGGTLGAGGATAAERSAFGQNPASLRPHTSGLRLDFHRPFGVAGLRVGEAGAYADMDRVGVAVDWRATEITGLFSEQGVQFAPALRLGDAHGWPGPVDLGFAAAAWRSEWPGGRVEWSYAQAWGAAWRPVPRLKVGAFAAGLPAHSGEARMDRILQAGLEAGNGDPESASQILRLDFRRTGDAPWRALASLSLRPHPAVEATAGLSVPPFQASFGCRFAWGGARVSQAVRYHRYLGRTWLSGIAYSRPLP